jgi:hypothetical protein
VCYNEVRGMTEPLIEFSKFLENKLSEVTQLQSVIEYVNNQTECQAKLF